MRKNLECTEERGVSIISASEFARVVVLTGVFCWAAYRRLALGIRHRRRVSVCKSGSTSCLEPMAGLALKVLIIATADFFLRRCLSVIFPCSNGVDRNRLLRGVVILNRRYNSSSSCHLWFLVWSHGWCGLASLSSGRRAAGGHRLPFSRPGYCLLLALSRTKFLMYIITAGFLTLNQSLQFCPFLYCSYRANCGQTTGRLYFFRLYFNIGGS